MTTEYEKPPEIEWDDERYIGHAYGSYGWGCNVVELEVDRRTVYRDLAALEAAHWPLPPRPRGWSMDYVS